MKLKLLISLAVIVAFVTGFLLGRWQARQSVDSHIGKLSMPEIRRATADFSKAAGLLKAIRAGTTNEALEDLEGELDTQVLLIGAVAEATLPSERDKQWLSRIRWLRDYRAQHPRKTEVPAIDKQVAHVLSLVETN